MKSINKLLNAAAAVLVSLTLCSCGGEAEKQQVRISTNQIETHPDTLALNIFADHINKKLGDKFEVKVYPNATLGANEKVLELIKQGSVQFLVLSTSNVETFDPMFTLFSIPYVFSSETKYEKFISDPKVIDILNTNKDKNGFEVITAFTAGTRNFYTKTPVRNVTDLAGKKIRVQASPTNVAMIEALGAAATPMAYGDVYSALQQSVIDGAENSELALTDMKHGEVCKYFTYDMHQMCPDVVVGSTAFLKTLSAEERQIFDEAADLARETEFKLWHEHTDEAIKIARDNMDVTFIEVDVNEFRERVMPLHQEFLTKFPQIKPLYELAQQAQQ